MSNVRGPYPISNPYQAPFRRGWQRAGAIPAAPDRMIGFCFAILAIICLWNLNGITAVAFGISRLLSVGILVCGLVIILRTTGQWFQGLGLAGKWFLAAIGLYLTVGVIVNRDRDVFINYANSIFVMGVSALAAHHYASRNATTRLLVWLTIFSVIGAFTVFLSPFLGEMYARNDTTSRVTRAGRWTGFFANPNETGFAGVFAFALCLAVWLLPARSTRLRKYLPLVCIGLGIGVVLTFSRSAILAFLALGIGFAIFGLRLGRRAIWTLVIAVWVAAIGFWFFTSGYHKFHWRPEQLKRIQSIEKMLTFQETTEKERGGRIAGSLGGLDYWSKSPIIGHGLNSMHVMPVEYFGGTGVHNTHIMILGESGLIGFTFYAVAVVIWIVTARRIRDPAVRNYCQLLWFAYMMIGMVSHDVLGDRNFNVLSGAAFGLMSVHAARHPNPSEVPWFARRRAVR